MAWNIQCTSGRCELGGWAKNIVDLTQDHRDEEGYFLCECGKPGFIEKSFNLQEAGEKWNPFLKGAIALGDLGDSYQPFVFLVSHKKRGKVDSVWFSYYKDLRKRPGGRLKLGYAPGGPPVLGLKKVRGLVNELISLRLLRRYCMTGELRCRRRRASLVIAAG